MAKTVLIVDDSKFIVDMLSKFFTETMKFCVVGTGKDGCEAIELFHKLKPDLMSLDITMPNKSGSQVIKELIKDFPDAKILIVSAVRGEPLIDCIQAGAADFVNKPLTFQNPVFVRNFQNIVNQIVP
jgi:two-component system chemotaxis response regulator CheY